MRDESGPAPGQPQIDLSGPFDAAKIPLLLGGNSWLGMRYHGAGEGWVEVALPWRADLTVSESSGIFASGPIITLLDSALGIAIWLRRGVLLPQATIDLRVDYMRPALPGRTVIGRAECYRLTRSIAFVRGIAYDKEAEDPVASVAGTYMMMDA